MSIDMTALQTEAKLNKLNKTDLMDFVLKMQKN